jgi:hypothetical protein
MKVSEVKKTINYASFFGASLTLKNLHLWLISPQTYSLAKVNKFLISKPLLIKQTISKPNTQKQKLVKEKTKSIKKLISIIQLIPTVNLIALTGSLSVSNPKKQDDIDLMIVTSSHALWLTRPLVILIVSIFSNRRSPGDCNANNKVCINLWLDEATLKVPKNKQNLYTAHEVLQTKPLFDRGEVHHQFILANSWVKKYLANAYQQISPRKPKSLIKANRQRQATKPLPVWNQLLKPFNLLAFRLQYFYMKSKITREYITSHAAYFHPRTLYPKIRKALL